MVALSREEREQLVLDLYFNQNKTYRQIAEEARMSPRDIGQVINKASKEKDRQQHKSLSTQAYDLFSKGKTPVEVAIMLNIRESEVVQYHQEYCRLIGQDSINQIYQEIKDDIWYFVSLYRSAKSAGMAIPNVINVLSIANNNLPSVQHKYDQLQRQIDVLEVHKKSSAKDFQNITDQMVAMGKRLESIQLECQNETTRMHNLYQKRMKLEALVREFENNNEGYNKIRKAAEDKVRGLLSDKKELLKRALFCLTESMRANPDGFTSLIYYNDNNNTSTATSIMAEYYNRQYYSSSFTYGGQQQQPHHYLTKDSFMKDYKDLILNEAERFLTSLENQIADEAVDENVSRTSTAAS